MERPAAVAHFTETRNQLGLCPSRGMDDHSSRLQPSPARGRSRIDQVAENAVELIVPHSHDYGVRVTDHCRQDAVGCSERRRPAGMEPYNFNAGLFERAEKSPTDLSRPDYEYAFAHSVVGLRCAACFAEARSSMVASEVAPVASSRATAIALSPATRRRNSASGPKTNRAMS
jgi:hypothetical protein